MSAAIGASIEGVGPGTSPWAHPDVGSLPRGTAPGWMLSSVLLLGGGQLVPGWAQWGFSSTLSSGLSPFFQGNDWGVFWVLLHPDLLPWIAPALGEGAPESSFFAFFLLLGLHLSLLVASFPPFQQMFAGCNISPLKGAAHTSLSVLPTPCWALRLFPVVSP